MRPQEDLQLRYETIVTGQAFDELLELAQQTCLTYPDTYGRNLETLQSQWEYSTSYLLAQRVGLWPTRHLFDNYVETARPRDLEGAITRNVPSADQPVDFPNLPLDPNVQNRIEALGQSLLDEAYLCLGEDVHQKVQEFKNAKSQADRVAVCEWVGNRVREIFDKYPAILDNNDEETDPDLYFHHPLKLSPKVIGGYPDVRARPTCLGVSIMVASFFEQTGANYLHGGVVRHSAKSLALVTRRTMHQVVRAIKKSGTKPSEELVERFNKALMNLGHAYGVNRGYHADVVVDIGDGDWMQIDPYYKSTAVVKGGDTKIGELHRALKESGVRGAEAMLYEDLIKQIGDAGPFLRSVLKKLPTVEELDSFLKTVDPLTADSELIEEYFSQYFIWGKKYSQPINYYGNQMTEYYQQDDPEQTKELYIHGVLVEAIADYVFPEAMQDLDISPFIKKCKQDSRYRRKSAEQLRLVPLLALLKLQYEFNQSVTQHGIALPHALTEFGLPAYRIGACVLSDFAAHTGDELPFSFWATYWPSHITFGEHMQRINTQAQQSVAKNVVKAIKHSRLTYDDIYLRII